MRPDVSRSPRGHAHPSPVEPETLGWRVRPAGDGAAAGSLRGVTLPGILQLLHIERRTCTVSVAGALGEHGELHLDDGRLVDARAGELTGEAAVHALCAGEAPEVVIAGLSRPIEQTIVRPLAHVLLEGARLADERLGRGEAGAGAEVTTARPPHGHGEVPLYSIEGGALLGPGGAALAGLGLALPDGAVTVLLGPEGVGKSLLLRALAGRPLPDDWRRQGSWRRRGRELDGRAEEEVLWLPQVGPHRILDAVERHELVRAVLGLVRSGPGSCLLLDEPTDESVTAPVAEIVRSCVAEGGGAVLATHDLRLARQVADYAVLLLPGQIAAGTAPGFFDTPPSEPARRFLAQGS